VRMALDQASWFWPVGVWFCAVGCGVPPEPEAVAGLEAGAEAGADAVAVGVQLGVSCGLDGATVGVAVGEGMGLAATFREVGCDAWPLGICAVW
jgi:hypothetical protein